MGGEGEPAAGDEAPSLARGVAAGERRALARAITLIESTRPEHRRAAEALLRELLPRTGRSRRVAITGVPGVGKSTFIETFGLYVIERGHRVAVLAVDPSSPLGGGSILGDKTRMERLATRPEAFIRPSPSGGTLGGVAQRTREALLACEAAGFDLVLVETVGVGQSEAAAAELVDMFVLLLAPGGGDMLQGLKRGIIEHADLVVVTKADGDLKQAAERALLDYANALRLLRPRTGAWTPKAVACSARDGTGIAEVWAAIGECFERLERAGEIEARRAEQARASLWTQVGETLIEELRRHPGVTDLAAALEDSVARGRIAPAEAARSILDAYNKR